MKMINQANKNYIETAVINYSDTLFRVAFQYVKNRADAEDVLQEVFLTLFKKPPQLSVDDEKLKFWLIRVTINKSKDFLRAKKRRREKLYDWQPFEHEHDFSDVFETIDKLSETDKNALYLHYYEGYTAKEIAQILGGTERAITKRISRARIKLKDLLKGE